MRMQLRTTILENLRLCCDACFLHAGMQLAPDAVLLPLLHAHAAAHHHFAEYATFIVMHQTCASGCAATRA
jgi:hypothetical protein